MERKLAAILAADIAGYSRLTMVDEEGTHAALRVDREVVDGVIAAHRGRIFGTAGDSVLAEFGSAIDAVKAALDFQAEMTKLNEPLPEDRRLMFRIGLNVGDVMDDGGVLFGNGVNVAVRVQEQAPPGGIFVTANFHDQVKNQLHLTYIDQGELHLKNIDEPVRVFQITLTPDDKFWRGMPRVGRHGSAYAGAILLIALVPTGWYFYPQIGDAINHMVASASAAPSIAILPLANLSGASDQEYFSDGLTNDITTDLSKFPNLFVVAANSAFTYKGKATKAQEIGRDLGVRYLLEGTVQKANGKIRINTQLIDAKSGHHIWAERYEGAAPDLFEFQDRIIQAVVTAMELSVKDAELKRIAARETKNLDAYELSLKGRAIFYDPQKQSKDGNDEARKYFQEAIKLDPNYSFAHAELSYVYVQDWQNDWSDNAEEALNEALKYAQHAVALDGNQSINHWNLAIVYSNMGKFDEAMNEYEIAKTLNPNDANLLAEMGDALVQQGRSQDAIDQVEQAINRNRKNTPYWYYWTLARALYMMKRYDSAIASVQKIKDPPYDLNLVLAVCYARKGMIKEAQAEVQKFLKFEPTWTVKDSARYHWKNPEDQKHWLEGLELAGLPKG